MSVNRSDENVQKHLTGKMRFV